MNTPRINRFLGEWLDSQTSPDFFKKGLILLNAYDFLDSKADAIPGLIAHKKSPLRQQLDEAITYYGLGAYFICRAIFNNEFDIDSGFQYDDEELFYEDIEFDPLFHNKPVFLLGNTPSDDMEVAWQDVGISIRRRAFN